MTEKNQTRTRTAIKEKVDRQTDQGKLKRPENQGYKQRDYRCGQGGAPNWTRQYICRAKTAECRNCKRKGHYEKMGRSAKKSQKIEKKLHQQKKSTGITAKAKE